MPGVEAAATTSTVPGNSYSYPIEFHVLDAAGDPNMKMLAETRWTSNGYFGALRIPVLQGEGCQAGSADSRMGSAYHSVVVNKSFAEKYFPNGGVIGHRLQAGAAGNGEIHGVVGDAREQGVEVSAQPTVYWYFSAPVPDPYFLVRVHGDPAAMEETIRKEIHSVEPGRSVFGLMPLEEHLGERQAESHLQTILLTLFAMTAISLVGIGLYGTISYLGRTRRREVGLRLALGALPWQIVRRFVFQGLRVTLMGGATGLVIGALLARLMRGMLYGVSTLDPWTYGLVFGLMMTIAAGACLVPSVRAANVDPTKMLREE